MTDHLPNTYVTFGKKLVDLIAGTEAEAVLGSESVTLAFEDGTRAEADYLVNCNSIKPRARQVLLPAGAAQDAMFTGTCAYRGLILMDQSRKRDKQAILCHYNITAHTGTEFPDPGPHSSDNKQRSVHVDTPPSWQAQ